MPLIASRGEILPRIASLNVWKRGDERAPHKPLLVLLALGRLAARAPRLISYDEIDPPLRALLEEFGPPRKSIHPEYPFWRLQTDHLWEVHESVPLSRRSSNADPLKSQLIQFKIKGGFPPPIHEAFRRDPALLREVATTLLRANFPPSLHDDILAAVGLDFESVSPRVRLSSFRSEVLAAYGHACAFCGLSVRLGSADLALDAAHIMWHQASGPDIPSNGLACCSLHHRALDRGAISLDDDLSILISTNLHGGSRLDELFLSLSGKPLRLPGRRADAPGRDFLLWHRTQVFHPPPRDA